MNRSASFSGVLLFVLSAVVAVPLAQQAPVFRSEANYVEVTARVVDRDGRFVEGLTAKDFEIREDFRQERVETAFRVDLPTPWNASIVARPALYRPDLPRDLQVAGGRVYLLYLNAVESAHIAITRKLAKDFVDGYLQPDDIVALWHQSRGLVTFTNEPARIHKAIDAFLGSNDVNDPVPATGDVGRIEARLDSALDWFGSVQGRRKSVLLFSAGWAGLTPVFNDRTIAVSTRSDLVDRADVQIYIVDTRGLVAPMSAASPIRGSDAGAAAANLTAHLDDLSQSVNELRWLAEDTGGFAIVNHNTYQTGFRRIVEENSQYYVLGYQSTAKRRPNWDYREIKVKVVKPGLPDVRVQARRGYIAR